LQLSQSDRLGYDRHWPSRYSGGRAARIYCVEKKKNSAEGKGGNSQLLIILITTFLLDVGYTVGKKCRKSGALKTIHSSQYTYISDKSGIFFSLQSITAAASHLRLTELSFEAKNVAKF